MVAKDSYIYKPKTLIELQQMEELFNKYDDDGSGTIEVRELMQMFKENGIQIKEEQMKLIFSTVDADKNGALNLREFKSFVIDQKAEEKFH